MTTDRKTDRNVLNDAELDRLLAGMAEEAPEVPAALMARVLEDAMAALPAPGGRLARDGSPLAGGFGEDFFASLFAAIGGWAGAGGLVTAGLVGLWFGIAPPSAVQSVQTEAQALLLTTTPDLTGGWADYGDSL